MVLPVTAKVEAAPNFLANLDESHRFFVSQDAESADTRFRKLKESLPEMIEILAWSPAGGRPARFMATKSAQGISKVKAISELAELVGLPNLREYVVGQHVVLYAHSKTEVVLLALKHQRQLTYSAQEN